MEIGSILQKLWSFKYTVVKTLVSDDTLIYHDAPYNVESGCYININVSEIHSGNCGNSTAHAQNIMFSPNWTGLFLTYLGWGGGGATVPPLSSLLVNQSQRNFAQQ